MKKQLKCITVHSTFYWSLILQLFLYEYIAEKLFFKRVENNLLLQVKQPSWEGGLMEQWEVVSSPQRFKKVYTPANMTLCRFFLNFRLTPKNIHHKVCLCVRVLLDFALRPLGSMLVCWTVSWFREVCK